MYLLVELVEGLCCTDLQFGITNLYPSITENLLMAAIDLAKNYFTIPGPGYQHDYASPKTHNISWWFYLDLKKKAIYSDGSVHISGSL